MSEITLKLYASGFDTVTVDCDEYEAAKVAGDLDQMLDVYVSDIETDTTIEEPDGTVVTLPEGNVLPPRRDTRHDRTDGPIHTHFGLTYASYQVLNRTLMQCMPIEWQERMVACLDELRQAYADVEQPESYIIKPARESTYEELTDAQMRLLNVTRPDAPDFEHDDIPDVYYDDEGTEHEGAERVYVPTGADPIPHYRRGWVGPGGRWALNAAEVDG